MALEEKVSFPENLDHKKIRAFTAAMCQMIVVCDPAGTYRGEVFCGIMSAICNMHVDIIATGLQGEIGRPLADEELKSFLSIASPEYSRALEFLSQVNNDLAEKFRPLIEKIREKHLRRSEPSQN